MINSRSPLFSATTTSTTTAKSGAPAMVPLLPKLRGQFAEFLNHSSPARLSMLYLTTCVGFGYGPSTHIARGFSRQYRITNITPYGLRITPHTIDTRIYLWCRATRLHHNPISGLATSLRHPITYLPRIRPHASHPTHHHKDDACQVFRVVSLTASALVAHGRVREYQPVDHRLRLSASP